MHPLLASLSDLSCVSCDQDGAIALGGRLCTPCADEIPSVLSRLKFREPTSLRGGWALGPYAGPAGALVRGGKYAGDEGALRALGQRLADLLPPMVADCWPDLVVPAPTSLGRSFWRGYDAVHLLARPVANALGVPMLPALQRWGGAPQASLGTADRLRNLHGRVQPARAIPPRARVLLVDDVRTTGATAETCSDALLGAGAAEVWLLVVCAA